jgi:hypothetical protein
MSTVEEVLATAKQMLGVARLGIKIYAAGDEDRFAGVYNVASGGRAVTFTLQKLRGMVDGFDEWYTPIQEDLANDRVCVWFKDLRNRLEKQGDSRVGAGYVYISSLSPHDLLRYAPPLVEGATLRGFVVGDELGRSFWNIRLPDGTEDRSYFKFPAKFGSVRLTMGDAPDDRDFAELAQHYVSKLEAIMNGAVARLGS